MTVKTSDFGHITARLLVRVQLGEPTDRIFPLLLEDNGALESGIGKRLFISTERGKESDSDEFKR